MYWANLIHFYQPPTQKPYWVKRVAEESYVKVIEGIGRYPGARVTLNINAILVELLVKNGYPGLVKKIANLAGDGRIELTQSAKYHPLLPKIPESEIIRQIELNDATNRKFFGDAWKPQGFFPPEMGFSLDVAKTVHKLGYKWIIVDETSFPGGVGKAKSDTIYTIEGMDDFAIFFRDRGFSFRILSAKVETGQEMVAALGERLGGDAYLVTGMDGETFGHHRPGLEHLLFELWNQKQVPCVTISELLAHFPKREATGVLPGTWALLKQDIQRNLPYARWDDPENEIHVLQWKLTDMVLETIAHADPKAKDFTKARELVDAALHSDQYWWASARPWWSIEMIEAGAKDLVVALHATPGVSEATKAEGQQLYYQILELAFLWQKTGKIEQMAKEGDEEIFEHVSDEQKEISTEEKQKMISTLEKQMWETSKAKEFERAARFRDRIRELQEERPLNEHTIEDDWGF